MKFLALTALVAVAYAQDEEVAAEALEANADCSAGGVCGDGLCCGTATGAEEGAEAKVICSDEGATEWVDEEDPDVAYTFACNEAAGEAGAAQLAVSAAALLTSAYLLA